MRDESKVLGEFYKTITSKVNIGYRLLYLAGNGRCFQKTGKNEKYEDLEWSVSEKMINGEYK